MFLEALHAARILADAAGNRSPRSVHHRHPRRSVYPTLVPQGILNPTAYFQSVMTEVLAGLNRKVWVDDIVWWGADEDDLLNTLDKIVGRLEDGVLFAAAHKCFFFDTEISWCGKLYSGDQLSHGRERLIGLVWMRRPQTAGGLMQFCRP